MEAGGLLEDTGLASLAIVGRFHGIPVDPAQLRHEFGKLRERFSADELVLAARRLGLKARAFQSSWERLTQTALPALVQQGDGSFLVAAKIVEGEGNPDEPEYDGTVHAFDVRALRLKTLSHKQYLDLCEPLDEARAATPEARAKLQAILAAEGYDGLYIIDDKRHELVVFPGSTYKVKPLTTTLEDEKR